MRASRLSVVSPVLVVALSSVSPASAFGCLLMTWSHFPPLPAAQPDPPVTVPEPLVTPTVYFGNLHSHTSYSDGSGTPLAAYEYARDVAGLDFMAITEHNHAAAPSRLPAEPHLYNGNASTSLMRAAESFTSLGSFVAIYGQEFSSIGSGNHANIFELAEVISETAVPNGEWDKLLKNWLPSRPDSMGQQALILLNHPEMSKSVDTEEYGRDDFNGSFEDWRTALDDRAELINIVNGPSHDSTSPGRPSESEFRRYLNLGFHLAPTADQDNHRTNWGNAAETRTGVIATQLSKPALFEAMRARHVYATEDKNLRLVARVNGSLIGTRFMGADAPPANSSVSITIDLKDDDEPVADYTVAVVTDTIGGEEEAQVQSFTLSNNGSHTLPPITYPGGNMYLYVRITQENDEEPVGDRAWLAPVWFEPDAVTPMGAGAPQLTLAVDLEAESAVVSNIGATEVDIGGWSLVSLSGNQVFTFPAPFQLIAGASVTVSSGPNATHAPPATLQWSTGSMWKNSGDPGELRKPDGTVVVSAP